MKAQATAHRPWPPPPRTARRPPGCRGTASKARNRATSCARSPPQANAASGPASRIGQHDGSRPGGPRTASERRPVTSRSTERRPPASATVARMRIGSFCEPSHAICDQAVIDGRVAKPLEQRLDIAGHVQPDWRAHSQGDVLEHQTAHEGGQRLVGHGVAHRWWPREQPGVGQGRMKPLSRRSLARSSPRRRRSG